MIKIFKAIQEKLAGHFNDPKHRHRKIRAMQGDKDFNKLKRDAHLEHQRQSFIEQEKNLLALGFKKKPNGGFTR